MFFKNGIPLHYTVSILACLASFLKMICQSSFTIAILAMVNNTEVYQRTQGSQECHDNFDFNVTSKQNAVSHTGQYSWDHYTQGILLGAESYGLLFTQIFGGLLSERYGAKWVISSGILFMGIFSAMVPTAADLGVPFVFIARLCQGMSEGVITPSSYTLISEWIEPSERATIIILTTISGVTGNGLGAILAGAFSNSTFMGGWPAAFYVPAIAAIVWNVLWVSMVTSSPADDPQKSTEKLISPENFKYIEKKPLSKKKLPIPWLAMLCSGPFWALIIIRIVHFWFSFTINTSIPLYMDSVFGFSIAQNGLINGILYGVALSGILFERFAKILQRRTKWSTTIIRKLFCAAAYGGVAVCWIFLPFSGCNSSMMIALLYTSKLFFTLSYAGDNVVMLDMAPRFSGTLFGLSATVGSCAGFLSPMLTGYITQQDVSISQWSFVFYIAVAIFLAGLIWFLLWGSAELQPWAEEPIPIENEKQFLASSSSASDYGSMIESV